MLSEKLSDIYLKVRTDLQQNNQDKNLTALYDVLKYALNRKNKRYDLADSVLLMTKNIDNSSSKIWKKEQNFDFKATFELLIYYYNHKEKFSIDTWAQIRGIPIGELANRISISPLALLNIRQGKSNPRISKVQEICDALDISIDELKLPDRNEKYQEQEKEACN